MECNINEMDYIIKDTAIQQTLGLTDNEISHCMDGRSTIYQQYHCGYEDEDLVRHQEFGTLGACLAIFICLLYRFTIYFLSSKTQLDQAVVDVKSMTTADYSVKVFLSKDLWKDWLEFKKDKELSSFKQYLKGEVEK